jgi:flavin reductase (DIM6/NTAB) family NADH-FMN oxidoreductase RutF
VTRAAFISAMSAAVTGVSVVTTDGTSGRLGLTVSSMTSVSADPPMLLVCINRRSPIVEAIRANGVFAVNVLGAHQAAVADTFAGRHDTAEPYDFASAEWRRAPGGTPLLVGAAARFDCRPASTADAGSHTIIVGEVVAADRGAVQPLAYVRRAYALPARLPVARGVAGSGVAAPVAVRAAG